MQALPPGVLIHFPKLEYLRIVLWHDTFSIWRKGDINSEDLDAIGKALHAFLTSESHAILVQVVIILRSHERTAAHFIATCSGGRWNVDVELAERESSA